MSQRINLTTLVCLLVVALAASFVPVGAQSGPDGYSSYELNMRAGPGVNYAVVTVLQPGTGLIFEARNADLSWLLGHTEDGAFRGWVASLYVSYREGFGSPSHLPVSDEIIAAQPSTAPGAGAGTEPDVASVIPIEALPVIPTIGPRASEIFARGQALGNDPHVFTQIGECNTLSPAFMVPFGSGAYDLGPYSSLQATIDFFAVSPVAGMSNSFWYKGVAMETGLTAAVVVDPTWSNPAVCPSGQSLLECEYNRSHPSVALIHLGLYDVYWLTPALYEQSMRRIIEISIQRGVIPVLTTFPTYPGDTSNWPNEAAVRDQNRTIFNQIVVNLGQEYGVPVINLWLAAEPLPWHGLKPGDYQHLLEPPGSNFFVSFAGDQNKWGFTMWNLVALQTLDQLRVNVLSK